MYLPGLNDIFSGMRLEVNALATLLLFHLARIKAGRAGLCASAIHKHSDSPGDYFSLATTEVTYALYRR